MSGHGRRAGRLSHRAAAGAFATAGSLGDAAVNGDLAQRQAGNAVMGLQRDLPEPGEDPGLDPLVVAGADHAKTLIAFTGTPITEADRNTRQTFGDYIDIYDLTRAVDDGATVPVFYESRLIPVSLPEGVDPEVIDERADEATAGLDDSQRERVQQAVAVMNAVYGAPGRLRELAADLVAHWEARSGQMRKFIDMPGKGLIVCATREICAKLYEEIIALRPEWHSDDVRKGKIKVVYTGAPGDPAPIRKHVRRPSQNKLIQHRARSEDPDEELELVIVQSMWLTGFDSPPLHTLYVDRPMRGAALMQALARVNRTFRGKKDGLLVGYAPLTMYSARWKPSPTCGRRRPTGDKSAAAALSGLEAAARVGGAWRRRPPRESGGPLPRPAGP